MLALTSINSVICFINFCKFILKMNFTIQASKNKMLKIKSNGYDIIFNSIKYRQFCSYTKTLKLSMNVPTK